MANEKKRVHTFVKVLLAVMIPIFIIALAFAGLCVYLQDYNDDIYPSVTIDGTDVSWLSREEAAQAINLQMYDTRGKNAEVTITYPDGSVFKATGEDVQLEHDARHWIDTAYSRGRGNGFLMNADAFLQRMYDIYVLNVAPERYEISYDFDMDALHSRVEAFNESYNSALEDSKPLIYSDKVVIMKGAGQVRADELQIYKLASEGLLESLAGGYPVEKSYNLPDTNVNTAELIAIRQSLYTPALSSKYDPETKTISESIVGVDFDYANAVKLLNGTESGKTASFDIQYSQPEVTKEYLEKLLFRDMIGECVTNIGGSSNRLNNILLAAAAINSIVLEPGERFSFNEVVGVRTSARGYKSAPAFSGGQTVQAVGGGICQVSSTIYSAIKDTDIQVTERHPHGQPISYLPRGRDATVSWGTLDFKFVNNTQYPLRVDVKVENRVITVQVFGTLGEDTDSEQLYS